MKELIKKAQALKTAKEIGCSGAHKGKDGNWMPCSSHNELMRISDIAETSKWRSVVPGESKKVLRTTGKKKKRKEQIENNWRALKERAADEWEDLDEVPIYGIESLPGGGLVSGDLFAGKAAFGPEYVRDNDPDVFIDPESARARARQLGCIGISRRISKTGRSVWMPCTNMTDYANRAGTTALGRRNMEKRRQNETRRAVRTILRGRNRATLRRKKSIVEELKHK